MNVTEFMHVFLLLAVVSYVTTLDYVAYGIRNYSPDDSEGKKKKITSWVIPTIKST